MSTDVKDEKNHVNYAVDDEHIEDSKKRNGNVDYSGAANKTDPKEIALVKKLDWRIMVRCCFLEVLLVTDSSRRSLCFGACTGSITWIVMPLLLPDSTIWRKT